MSGVAWWNNALNELHPATVFGFADDGDAQGRLAAVAAPADDEAGADTETDDSQAARAADSAGVQPAMMNPTVNQHLTLILCSNKKLRCERQNAPLWISGAFYLNLKQSLGTLLDFC